MTTTDWTRAWRDALTDRHREVLVAEPERLPDPHPGVEQHREQQPVPQVLTGIQDRLDLLERQDPRDALGRLDLDGALPLRLLLGDVVQERLPRCAGTRVGPPGDQ